METIHKLFEEVKELPEEAEGDRDLMEKLMGEHLVFYTHQQMKGMSPLSPPNVFTHATPIQHIEPKPILKPSMIEVPSDDAHLQHTYFISFAQWRTMLSH